MKLNDVIDSLIITVICFLIATAVLKYIKASSVIDYIAVMRYTLEAIHFNLFAIICLMIFIYRRNSK